MGVKKYIQAENKGMKQPTNEDYREESLGGSGEGTEKYGEEKHNYKKPIM